MEDLKYLDLLKENNRLAGSLKDLPVYEIGILSNVTVNSFKEVLAYGCRINNISPNIEIGNYDNIAQDSPGFANKKMVIVFYDLLNIVDSVSVFFETLDIATFTSLKEKLFAEIDIVFENLKHVQSLVFNSFSAAYFPGDNKGNSLIEKLVKELNHHLDEKQKQKPGTVIVNIDKIYAEIGIKQAIDMRFYHSSKAPYTIAFFKNYFNSIKNTLLQNNGKLKKTIIFDCDNTLWPGIIGEDGADGIDFDSKTGKYYKAVQQIAAFLSSRGILIGICSKNNEQDVLDVFKYHKGMFLKEENIVIKKINWQDKATNLREIAKELNIGIDSLLFVDDSNFEIDLIRQQLPDIVTLQVPSNIADYPQVLMKTAYEYFNLKANKEDTQKTEMYQQQFQRENTKSTFASLEDFLASLEIEIRIKENDAENIARISQLTQKSNQFNLTTYRYTEEQIGEFIANAHQFIFTLSVGDKFGDSGLTGVCIIKQGDNPYEAEIDSLLMSCRIIGRNIEYVFIDRIIETIFEKGYTKIKARFIPTLKNQQVIAFYESAGFTVTGGQENIKYYRLNLKDYKKSTINYIKIKND